MRLKFKRATTSSIPATSVSPVNKEVTTLVTNNANPTKIGNTEVVSTTNNPPPNSPSTPATDKTSNIPVQPPLTAPSSTGSSATTTTDPLKTDSLKTDTSGTAPANSPVTASDLVAVISPNAQAVQQNNPLASQQNNAPIIPNNAPVLSESPKGQNVEIKPASQVTAVDPTKTVEYFVSYGLTQTVLDDKTTSVYKTQTYAAIRPIATAASSAECIFPFSLLLLLLFIFK